MHSKTAAGITYIVKNAGNFRAGEMLAESLAIITAARSTPNGYILYSTDNEPSGLSVSAAIKPYRIAMHGPQAQNTGKREIT